VLAGALLVGPAATGEVLRVESVGAAPVREGDTSQVSKRQAALERAVHDAVIRVAEGLLAPEAYAIESPPTGTDTSGESGPTDPRELLEARLDAALGDRPFEYAVRFRILEDRGERPALFADDPEVVGEYLMVAEVFVDSDRVRQRLAEAGIPLTPLGGGELASIRIVLLDLDDFRAFSAVRTALQEDARVESVVPVEMERGRATLEVVASRDVDQLLRTLRERIPEDVRVEPVAIELDQLTLRVSVIAPDSPGPAPGGASVAAPAIDTTGRNRY
jgi:hypothetical protein